jgi:hypothetical protein
MMKARFVVASLMALFMVSQSCKNNADVIETEMSHVVTDQTITVEEAKSIYERHSSQFSNGKVGARKFEKKAQWDYAQKEKFTDGREAIIVPVSTDVPDYEYGVVSQKANIQNPKTAAEVFTTHKIVVYKDKGKDKVELLSIFGEADYKRQHTYFDYDWEFTGAMVFRTLDGDFLRGFYYDKGKRLGSIEQAKNSPKNGRPNACYVIQSLTVFMYTVTIGSTTYPAQPNGDVREVWFVMCDGGPQGIYATPNTYNVGNVSGGSSVSSASTWIANAYQQQAMFNQLYTFEPTDKTYIDHVKHLNCFSNTAGSACTITLNIDQPVNGSSSALNPSTAHRVGHAFLTIQQTMPDGTVYRASIGFYPGSGGNPLSPGGTPKFKDDGIYTGSIDVRTTFNVSPSEMMTVVNYVKWYDNGNYDLITRNCGNMCIDAMSQIGINLPTGWMSYPWYPSPVMGTSYNNWVSGPSIGMFGEQMKGFSNSKVTNTNSSTSKSGNCN